MKVNKNIPVLFQTIKDFDVEDTRFTKVKIWMMHLKENFNGSFFTQEDVEKAIPSLANTPIMGLMNYDEDDFTDHGKELELDENDNVKVKTVTQPYGVIPEFNNAKFEDRVGDDGVTRTYLTAEGLLWNKWEDAINVLNSQQGSIGQSMELADDFTGEFKEDGLFHFKDFKFDGACLLGSDVEPAMINSTVELSFSDKVGNEIQEKLALYTKSFEGGNSLEKNKDLEKGTIFEEEENKNEEPETEEEEKEEEPVVEDPKEPEAPEEEETPEEPEEPEDPKQENSKESESKNPYVTVSEENIQEARAVINKEDEEKESPQERIHVGDTVYSIEEATDLLKEFFALKKEIHKEKIDAIFAQYQDSLSDEEMKALKTNCYENSAEDLENKIFAVIGRKSFSSKQKESPKVNFSTVKADSADTQNDPYGGILSK